MKELRKIWTSPIPVYLKVLVTTLGLVGAILAWKLVVYLIECI